MYPIILKHCSLSNIKEKNSFSSDNFVETYRMLKCNITAGKFINNDVHCVNYLTIYFKARYTQTDNYNCVIDSTETEIPILTVY